MADVDLFRVEIGTSSYIATGRDAYNAVHRVAEHEDNEACRSHEGSITISVKSVKIGTATEPVLAWYCE